MYSRKNKNQKIFSFLNLHPKKYLKDPDFFPRYYTMHRYICFILKMNIKIFWAVYIRDVLKQCAYRYNSVTCLN